ncbi:Golgi transport complex subunit 4 [Tyrophagus putrescentiae]|nr:Golgi transport complex subunit 4 [Tyrophagus putrescentiae]
MNFETQQQNLEAIEAEATAELQAKLSQLSAEEATLEAEVDGLLDGEVEHLQTLLMGQLASPKHLAHIGLIGSDAERLASLMDFTAALADTVSGKIRAFDAVKGRVGQCLQQVEDIIDLRACTEGIQKALMGEEYEVAARLIYRFLAMDESMLRRSALAEDSKGSGGGTDSLILDTCSLEQSFAKLHEAERRLKTIVSARFDEAVADRDLASVERFFKIFPLIGQQEEGLRKYAAYLCAQISEQMAAKKKANAAAAGANISSGGNRAAAYLEKLSALFETIARTVDVHYPLIETYYGPGNLLPVVLVLQAECDRQSAAIISEFKAEKNFAALSLTISRHLKQMSSHGGNGGKQQGEQWKYRCFTGPGREGDRQAPGGHHADIEAAALNRSVKESGESSSEKSITTANKNNSSSSQKQAVDALLRECMLTQLLHDLNSTYVLLEEYYLKESVLKAIQLDTVDLETMLDDIFFILKKCLKRSISCGSLNVLLALLNHCVTVLETSFYEVTAERLLKVGYPSGSAVAMAASSLVDGLGVNAAYTAALQAGRYLQSSTEVERTRVGFLAALNNLDTAVEYVRLLSDTVTEDVRRSGILAASQAQLFESCLAEFGAVAGRLRQLTVGGVQALYGALLKAPVKTMVDGFSSTSHILADEEAGGGLRPYMANFLLAVSGLLGGALRRQLAPANFDLLLGVLATEVANRLYKALFKCSFNKFGGFQFDREVRALISYLGALSASATSVREAFAKLKFIAVLFTLENGDEVAEYVNASERGGASTTTAALRIHPNELHVLLRLYTELSPTELKRIKV